MARRIGVLVGLLCMLLHAGLVAVHHVAPGAGRAPTERAEAAEPQASELLLALTGSMCRSGAPTDAGGALPAGPAENGQPCLVCCCPASASLLAPAIGPCLPPRLALLPPQSAWDARPIVIRKRLAERPPVRAPPAFA